MIKGEEDLEEEDPEEEDPEERDPKEINTEENEPEDSSKERSSTGSNENLYTRMECIVSWEGMTWLSYFF